VRSPPESASARSQQQAPTGARAARATLAGSNLLDNASQPLTSCKIKIKQQPRRSNLGRLKLRPAAAAYATTGQWRSLSLKRRPTTNLTANLRSSQQLNFSHAASGYLETRPQVAPARPLAPSIYAAGTDGSSCTSNNKVVDLRERFWLGLVLVLFDEQLYKWNSHGYTGEWRARSTWLPYLPLSQSNPLGIVSSSSAGQKLPIDWPQT